MVLRSERTGVEKRFYELCQKVVTDQGLELYDLDYLPGNSLLRVFIKDPQTNTAVLDDCVKIDRALTPYFESEEWMPQQVTLEVSSPGIFRPLKTLEHFKTAEGETVSLELVRKLTEEDVEGLSKKNYRSKKITATLLKSDDQGIEIELEGKSFRLGHEDIKKANIEKEL